MKNLYAFLFILCAFVTNVIAQNEAEIKADGVVFPKLSAYPISPDQGQVIYFNPNAQFEYFNGVSWQPLSSNGSLQDEISDSTDGDTYVRTVESGTNDYITLKVNDGGEVRFYSGLNDDMRMEFNNPNFNVLIGNNAGDAMNGGANNICIGEIAGSQLTTGSDNTLVGRSAGYFLDIDSCNTFVGRRSGYRNKNSNNTFIGFEAGTNSDESTECVYVGAEAGRSSEGNFSTAIGFKSGMSMNSSAYSNTFLGHESGEANSSGFHNTFVGQGSGEVMLSGAFNTYLGSNAGTSNTDQNYNTFLGFDAGRSTNGSNSGSNTFVGAEAGERCDGNNNVFVGRAAGDFNVTGLRNTYVGAYAGDGVNSSDSGNGNVYIGYQAGQGQGEDDRLRITTSGNSFPLIFGYFDSDRVAINWNPFSAITQTFSVNGGASKSSPGDWVANSDQRLKKNIEHLSSDDILQKLLQMKGVSYEWNDNQTGIDRPEGIQYGFVAQELQTVWPDKVETDENGFLSTAYGTYDFMYVEAIKALNKKIEDLSAENNELRKDLENLISRLDDK